MSVRGNCTFHGEKCSLVSSSTPADRPTRRRRKPLIEHQKAEESRINVAATYSHHIPSLSTALPCFFWGEGGRGLLFPRHLLSPASRWLSVGPLCDRVEQFSAPQDGEGRREGGRRRHRRLVHHCANISMISTLYTMTIQ